MRGHGSTRVLNSRTPRFGRQGAIGVDVIALMDALPLQRAVLAEHDWGGRAACVAAALWPERCAGLESVNGYLIQEDGASRGTVRGQTARDERPERQPGAREGWWAVPESDRGHQDCRFNPGSFPSP